MPGLADEPLLAAFLDEQQALTMSVAIDAEGTIHIAAITYYHKLDPLKFYFVTGKDTEKCRMLLDGSPHKAACVVGTWVDTPFTLQMRGTIRIVPKGQAVTEIMAYTKKRGDSHGAEEPENVLLEFTPNWARYIDYSKGWQHHMLDL